MTLPCTMMPLRSLRLLAVAACYLATSSAFVIPQTEKPALVTRQALWRHFVPRDNGVWDPEDDETTNLGSTAKNGFLASCLAFVLVIPIASLAVSGGGLDFANLDITGQNFSNGNYKGKDFTQVIAKGTNFANSNLQGCRFYKAYLVNANFEGTNLRGAALEDTSMDGANLKGANAAGAYFGASIFDVKTMENADFTDATLPLKTIPLVCAREDVKGTNPVTGADTRESLMCP